MGITTGSASNPIGPAISVSTGFTNFRYPHSTSGCYAQQNDELDAIRTQVEQLQIQRVQSPPALEESTSSSGSSPAAGQSRFDLNQPVPEQEMQDEEQSHPPQSGT
jgi:hypothetical protein